MRRFDAFKVVCPADGVAAAECGCAAVTFTEILSKAAARNWNVTKAEIASVSLVAAPLVDDEEAGKSFHGINRLMRIASSPSIDRSDAEEFHPVFEKMSRVVNDTGGDLILSTGDSEGRFTADLLNEAENILRKASHRSFGHVTGTIDKLILQPGHGNRSIGLVDNLTGMRTNIVFPETLDGIVTTLTPGTIIDAKGFISRNTDKDVRLVAEDIVKVVRKHHPLVTAQDLEGVFNARIPKDMDSVALVRRLREEQKDVAHLSGDDRR